MKYLYMNGNIVNEVHYDDDPQFSIHKKYPADYLASCMQVTDDVAVNVGDIYRDGVFLIPEPEDPTTPIVPGKPTQAEIIKQLESKLDATVQDKATLEECLVEMASIVYA